VQSADKTREHCKISASSVGRPENPVSPDRLTRSTGVRVQKLSQGSVDRMVDRDCPKNKNFELWNFEILFLL